MNKIHDFCYHTGTGTIYVYPIGDEYKKQILKKDNFGYFFKRKGVIERINNTEEIERVKNYINN